MSYIIPAWDAPNPVRALTTTRQGGVSLGPYSSLNLGDHVDDDPEHVAQNRQRLIKNLNLTTTPQWLNQVHGVEVVEAKGDGVCREADACWSAEKGQACIVMTADCLPVFFCDRQGRRVAVAHAGWRGLLNGVLEQTLKVFSAPEQVIAALGPAIGPKAFEVGSEVRELFCQQQVAAEQAFVPVTGTKGKYLADLYQLARLRLYAAGVTDVTGGKDCTYTDEDRFFSYRRDGQTGRLASVIWIE